MLDFTTCWVIIDFFRSFSGRWLFRLFMIRFPFFLFVFSILHPLFFATWFLSRPFSLTCIIFFFLDWLVVLRFWRVNIFKFCWFLFWSIVTEGIAKFSVFFRFITLETTFLPTWSFSQHMCFSYFRRWLKFIYWTRRMSGSW